MGLTKREHELLLSIAGCGDPESARHVRLAKVPYGLQRSLASLLARNLIASGEHPGAYQLTEWGIRAVTNPKSAPKAEWASALLADIKTKPKWWVCCEIAEILRASPVDKLVEGRIGGDGWRFDASPFVQISPVACNIGEGWESMVAEFDSRVQIDVWNESGPSSHREILDIFLVLREELRKYVGPFLCYSQVLLTPANGTGEPDYLSPDRLRSDWRAYADSQQLSPEIIAQRRKAWLAQHLEKVLGASAAVRAHLADAIQNRLLPPV